jgi:hypothetical protein
MYNLGPLEKDFFHLKEDMTLMRTDISEIKNRENRGFEREDWRRERRI